MSEKAFHSWQVTLLLRPAAIAITGGVPAGHLAPARKSEWVVFAKRPFAGPEQVLTYVGRYTRRIAIANSRLLSIDDGRVRFRWKSCRRGNPHSADDFDRRRVHTAAS